MYDRFIRKGFGKKKISSIKYSDVIQFYQHLQKDKQLQINTLETIHTVLHPTFQIAVRDNIICVNPKLQNKMPESQQSSLAFLFIEIC